MIVTCDCYSTVKLGTTPYLIGSSWAALWHHRGSRAHVSLRTYPPDSCVVPGGGRGIDTLCAVVPWAAVSRGGYQIGDIAVFTSGTL